MVITSDCLSEISVQFRVESPVSANLPSIGHLGLRPEIPLRLCKAKPPSRLRETEGVRTRTSTRAVGHRCNKVAHETITICSKTAWTLRGKRPRAKAHSATVFQIMRKSITKPFILCSKKQLPPLPSAYRENKRGPGGVVQR